MHVTSLQKLAHEIKARIGRGSLASVKAWLAEGAPAKTAAGYCVDDWVAWVEKNKPEWNGQGVKQPELEPGEEIPSPKNWAEQLSKKRAEQIELEMQVTRSELVPVDLMVSEFGAFTSELVSQLDQLEIDLPRMVDPKACNKTNLKHSVRQRIDAARQSCAKFIESLADTLTQSTTAFDDAPNESDPPSEPSTKSGSRKTSTSRRASARAPATTSSKADSNTGAARSKPSRTKKSKKSS